MKAPLRVALVGLIVLMGSIAAVLLATDPRLARSGVRQPSKNRNRTEGVRSARTEGRPAESVPLYSAGFVDDSGFDLAMGFMPKKYDRSSLEAHREAIKERGRRGIAQFTEQLSRVPEASSSSDSSVGATRARIEMLIGLMHMYDGRFEEAAKWVDRARRDGTGLPREYQANLEALLGVAALRRGELENCVACVGPSSCIFPIAPEAVHQFPSGSRAAIEHFQAYLKQRPEDLGVRWLLNVAYMTLGEYPAGVPEEYLVPLDRFRSPCCRPTGSTTSPREVGPRRPRPEHGRGIRFDDFTGDGLPDIFFSPATADRGASLFVNRGDGPSRNGRRRSRPGEPGHVAERPARRLRQRRRPRCPAPPGRLGRPGADVPAAQHGRRSVRGRDRAPRASREPIASQSAAWGDYDNDGKLDLYVVRRVPSRTRPDRIATCAGSTTTMATARSPTSPTGRGHQRGWAKGAAWGDYDDDGRLDLYVSNMRRPQPALPQRGRRHLHRRRPRSRAWPSRSTASRCWFWDYDNDGRLDLFVCGYSPGSTTSSPTPRPARPPPSGPGSTATWATASSADVTAEAGLDRVMLPMGSNFGDIDNDGFLDMYLGTGRPVYSSLVPNLMFKNVEGRRFEDVTEATGTGHLQKGHGVSFADWDGDGDLDLFVEIGGAAPGDQAHNVLFQNPGHGQAGTGSR